jgi:hypothetical protein
MKYKNKALSNVLQPQQEIKLNLKIVTFLLILKMKIIIRKLMQIIKDNKSKKLQLLTINFLKKEVLNIIKNLHYYIDYL